MPVRDDVKRPLIGAIDDGTKTVRFVIYEAERSEELVACQLDKTEVTPHEGWSEQDPLEIIHHIKACAENAIGQLTELGYSKEDIVTLGITNQRETTIAWDKYTGEPLHPAIAWNDIRTDSTVDAILAKVPDRNKNYLKGICGLPISPYFSALKMRWLKDHVKAVRRASRDKRLLFGTVDTWIVWNLTGGPQGGLHLTDVTNASRTLLMNLDTLNWDPMLCRLFGIHRDSLPQIRSSSEVYGVVKDGSSLDGIRISGILGNQQSALVGQNCLQAGQAKNTYRSGCFLLYNTGTRRVQSTHGLITTLAYRLGPDAPPVYALEGSIAVAGGAMKFLRDNLKLIKDVAQDTEHIAGQVFSTGDVYFVPAFSGLYAPYWRKDARGIICGLTAFTTKNHIIRAALEAVCFQTRDILEAMHKDCGMPLSKLHVDGKMTSNDLLMQLQADLIGIPVLRAHTWDMSPLGVAIVAGSAVGVWSVDKWRQHATPTETFLPTTTDDDRDARYTKWKMAVQRSLGWATTKKSITMTGQGKRKSSMSTIHQSFDLPANRNLKNFVIDEDDNSDVESERNSLVDVGSRTNSVIDEESRKNSVVNENFRSNSVVDENSMRNFSIGDDSSRNSVIDENGSNISVIDEDSVRNSVIEENGRSNSFIDDDSRSTYSVLEGSEYNSVIDEDSRRNSFARNGEGDKRSSLDSTEDVTKAYEELLKYSARKFSIFVPAEDERTILDDLEYFTNKKECDFGMCQCCHETQKKLHTNWESIEEIIENDPEIIFDRDDNPIFVEPVSENSSVSGHKSHKPPSVFKTLYNKLSESIKKSKV